MGEASSVKVAVRVRPMNRNEQMEGCKDVLTSPPSSSLPLSSGSSSPLSSSSSSASTKQIFLGSGSEKSFTFDEVFGWQVPQSVVFATCVSPLLDRFIEGYNGTILAYGQTGSGKTYSMGTASSASASASSASPADFQAALDDVSLGIIPRSAVKLFEALRQMEAKAQRMGLPRPLFEVRTSFLELYNEELIDLLHKDSSAPSSIRIKEDPTEGGIQLVGLTEEQVTSPRDLLLCLERGAANRTTGATEMNKTSSRSHAIFTIALRQKLPVGFKDNESGTEAAPESESSGEISGADTSFENLQSKFHFVDLAGSERLKKTMAVGDRAKEGININMGLLALGNVISALGDESRKATFVPYRDSKLTRILQNSLGGNSRTLMIACVSPSDSNFMETHSTLNYANRARNIKNKVVINRDLEAMEANQLRKQIQILKQQLALATATSSSSYAEEMHLQKIADLETEMKGLTFNGFQLQQRVSGLQEELLESQILIAQLRELVPSNKQAELEAINTLETQSRTKSSAQVAELELVAAMKSQLAEAKQQAELYRFQFEELRSQRAVHRPGEAPSIVPQLQESRSNALRAALSRAKEEVEQLESLMDPEESPEDPRHDGEEDHEDFEGSGSSESDDEGETGEVVPKADDKPLTAEEIERKAANAGMMEKLRSIHQSIVDKEELVRELERAEQEIYQLKLQFEGKLFDLLQEKTEVMKERDEAMGAMQSTNRSEKELESIREQYERRLKGLVEQINTYRQKLADNQKTLKQKVQTEQQLPALKQSVEELRLEKQELIRKIRDEQKTNKSFKEDTTKELKRLVKMDMQKTSYIKQLEKNNETQRTLLKKRVEETILARAKLKTVQQVYQQKLEEQRKQLLSTAKPVIPRVMQREQNTNATASQKKAQLDKDLSRCVLARETNNIMEALLKKREDFVTEYTELSEHPPRGDGLKQEERLSFIGNEVGKLNTRISELQAEVIGGMDNGKEIHDQVMYHVRLLSPIEARKILQLMCDDVIQLRLDLRKKDAHVDYLRFCVASLEKSTINNAKQLTPEHLQEGSRSELQPDKGSTGTWVGETEEPVGFASMEEDDIDMDMETDSGFLVVQRESDNPRTKEDINKLSPRKRSGSAPEIFITESFEGAENQFRQRVQTSPLSEDSVRPRAESFHTNQQQQRDADSHGDMGGIRSLTSSPVPGESVFSRLTQVARKETTKKHEIHQEEPNSLGNKLIECTHTLKGHAGAVFGVAILGDKIYSASQDSTVKVWDIALGEVTTITAFSGFVRAIVVTSVSLFTACEASIKVWDLNGTQLIRTLTKHSREVVVLAVNPGETLLFSSSVDNSVCVWDLKTLTHIRTIKGFKNAVTSFEFHDTWLITGSKDRLIRIYDLTTFEMKHSLQPPHYDSVSCLASLGNILYSAGGSQFGFIKQWSLKTLSDLATANNAHRESVQSMVTLKEGAPGGLLLSASKDGIIKAWGAESSDCLGELRGHEHSINQMVLHHQKKPGSSTLLLTASNDKTVRVWRLKQSQSSSS